MADVPWPVCRASDAPGVSGGTEKEDMFVASPIDGITTAT